MTESMEQIIARRQPALEQRDGEEIGRDPRKMTMTELEAAGHARLPLSKAIRRCLEAIDVFLGLTEVRQCNGA